MQRDVRCQQAAKTCRKRTVAERIAPTGHFVDGYLWRAGATNNVGGGSGDGGARRAVR